MIEHGGGIVVRLIRVSKFRTLSGHTRIDLISTERVSILSTSHFADHYRGSSFSPPFDSRNCA